MVEKEETEQPSEAKKGARRRKKKTQREREQREKQAEASARQRESEQRTCAGGGEREPVSTRQGKRMRVQLISASSSVAVMNDLGGIVAAPAASEQHTCWLSLTCG